MPFCRQCGAEMKDEERFCAACGTGVDPAAEGASGSDANAKPQPTAVEVTVKQPVAKKQIGCGGVFLVIVLVVILVAVWPKGGSSSTETNHNYSAAASGGSSTRTTTAPVSPWTTTAPSKTYSDGMYHVGTDIPAGLYRGVVDGAFSGYWEVSKDASGSFGSLLANDNVDGPFYVEVKDGRYLTLKRCTIISADAVSVAQPMTKNISDGMYLVGTDIAAGRYKGTTTGEIDGYWEIDKSALGVMASIVSNDNVSGQFYVQVKAGQYLKLNRVTISLD